MEKELKEIKEKILNFCDKYDVKDIKIETTNIVKQLTGIKVIGIGIKIEV